MVFLDLKISFISDNLSELYILPTFQWCFAIRCSKCYTDHPKEIYFSEKEEFAITNSKGTANFVFKCKECNSMSSINVYEKSNRKIKCSEGKGEGILATFECRGCELTKWIISDEGFYALALESDKIFDNVDLNDVWMDYDEKSKGNCMIDEFRHEIVKNKNL